MTQPNNPYSTSIPFRGPVPDWTPSNHSDRVASYAVYEGMYWNSDETLRVLMRGSGDEEDSVYVPTPRIIIETLNRYIGAKFGYAVEELSGTPESRATALLEFTKLFRRERFLSQYNSSKRFGLVRGDWGWHVFADPLKPAGSRISIVPVHPGNWFPTYEDEIVENGDPSKLVKVWLAEEAIHEEETVVRRLEYWKNTDQNGVTAVWRSLSLWKPDEWTDPEKSPILEILQMEALPLSIQTIPVYMIPNFEEPGRTFGSSELRGYERVFNAINQSITDEDTTLALEGLGVYATDSNQRPVNPATGAPEDWTIYPGRVVSNAQGLRRLDGVKSVVPYGDHIDRILGFIKESSGSTDAAVGRVDVEVAESGVALLLHMSPTLAKAEERDQIILDRHTQMFWDLRFFFKEYEGINLDDVIVNPTLGDKLPKNHKALVDMISLLMTTVPPVLSAQSARELLQREGLNWFAADEAIRVALEQATVQASADGVGARQEAEGGDNTDQDALEDDGE